MCNYFSCVVTKTGIYADCTDSHENIIARHGLKERNVRNEVLFVRVELVPSRQKTGKRMFVYKRDQDLLPDWYEEKKTEARVRLAFERSKIDIYRKKYDRITGPAWARYNRITGSTQTRYNQFTGPGRTEYIQITDLAWAEYDRIVGPARTEYNRVEEPARAEYNRIIKKITEKPL